MSSRREHLGGRSVERQGEDDQILLHAVLRLNGVLLGLVFGIVLALVIFVATVWLTLKGGPHPGRHLSLLGQFFWGYSVTWLGSLIGALYGLVLGFMAGWVVAWVYNGVASLRSGRRS
jgi:tetrahydromethanopterin S-methyltransferase subunit G